MNEQEFRTLAEAWGGQIARWPEQHRATAAQFAATPTGRSILLEAGEIDALLSPDPDRQVAPVRVGRAIAAVQSRIAGERQQKGWFSLRMLRLVIPSATLAAAGMLGVVAALAMSPDLTAPEPGAAELLAVALSFSDPGFLTVAGG